MYCIGWFQVGDLAFGQVGKRPEGILKLHRYVVVSFHTVTTNSSYLCETHCNVLRFQSHSIRSLIYVLHRHSRAKLYVLPNSQLGLIQHLHASVTSRRSLLFRIRIIPKIMIVPSSEGL